MSKNHIKAEYYNDLKNNHSIIAMDFPEIDALNLSSPYIDSP